LQPEFFLDRNLGRRVAEALRARGWTVHRIVDVFPADAQDIPDEEWIAHGLDQSWVPLSKDGQPYDLLEEILSEVGERGISAYIAEALRLKLDRDRDRLRELVDWLEEEHGQATARERAAALEELDDLDAEHRRRAAGKGRAGKLREEAER
jgi:hypothetical protein